MCPETKVNERKRLICEKNRTTVKPRDGSNRKAEGEKIGRLLHFKSFKGHKKLYGQKFTFIINFWYTVFDHSYQTNY